MSYNVKVLANIFETIDPTKEIANVGDKLQYGATMLLLGMATIFAVLTVIWLSLVIFKVAFQSSSEKEKKSKPASAPVAPQPTTSQSQNDEEIVAVIAAAIAMAESEGNGLKFRVVSFRRI